MILVTGASGNVGGKVVDHLLVLGQAVRVLTRDASRVARFGSAVEKVVGDLSDPDSLVPALKDVEGIFLVTGDTQMDRNVLAVARRTGARHIVKLSTQEAGWTPVEGHGRWHHEREELIRASGTGWTFLRPTMLMSNALAWADTIRKESTVYYTGGEGRLPPIDPDDVGAVAAICLTRPGHEGKGYELTGPQLLSFREMTETLSLALGKTLRYVDIPEEEFGKQLVEMKLPRYAVDGLLETFRLVRKGRFAYLTDDAERVLGRKPRTFQAWCAAHLDDFS